MYHELYIDVFFLENLMMDSLLLLAINRILQCKTASGRLFLSGALASLFTCVAVVVPFPWIIKLFLFHVVINSMMLLTGLRIRSVSQFAKAYVLLYVISVFMGGIMTLFRPHMRFAAVFYGAAFTAYLLIANIWKLLVHLSGQQNKIVSVTIYTERGETTADALFDTGNSLRDFVTGMPVHVVDPGLLANITDSVESERGFHLIPYQCVGGSSLMEVFHVRKMCVHTDTDRWIADPVIGVSKEPVSAGNEYKIILNPESIR